LRRYSTTIITRKKPLAAARLDKVKIVEKGKKVASILRETPFEVVQSTKNYKSPTKRSNENNNPNLPPKRAITTKIEKTQEEKELEEFRKEMKALDVQKGSHSIGPILSFYEKKNTEESLEKTQRQTFAIKNNNKPPKLSYDLALWRNNSSNSDLKRKTSRSRSPVAKEPKKAKRIVQLQFQPSNAPRITSYESASNIKRTRSPSEVDCSETRNSYKFYKSEISPVKIDLPRSSCRNVPFHKPVPVMRIPSFKNIMKQNKRSILLPKSVLLRDTRTPGYPKHSVYFP